MPTLQIDYSDRMTRNIALLILDTVRKDYFDNFAARIQSLSEVSFDQCRAASSCSVPSHASIMTGELSHQHGIHSANVDYSGLNDENTFLGELPEHQTIGVSANTFAGTPFGFNEMFDDFVDVSWTRRFPAGMDAREYMIRTEKSGLAFYVDFLKTALRHDSPLSTVGNAVSAQLDVTFSQLPVRKLFDDGTKAGLRIARRKISDVDEPFFLFMNLMEAHTPHQPTWGYDQSLYSAPNDWSSLNHLNQWDINRNGTSNYEEDIRHFRDIFAASIDYLDRKVARFISEVRSMTDQETTFVITADHGENLGYPADDGLFGHNSSLSEALLHVPLILINPPDGYQSTEQDYFSHLKLGELLAGLGRGETPDVFADRIPSERILTTNLPDVDADEKTYWNRMLRCVYEGESKVVWDSMGGCIEYDLDIARPCWQRERSDSRQSPPSWASDFFDTEINDFKGQIENAPSPDIDDATRARLEELGYL